MIRKFPVIMIAEAITASIQYACRLSIESVSPSVEKNITMKKSVNGLIRSFSSFLYGICPSPRPARNAPTSTDRLRYCAMEMKRNAQAIPCTKNACLLSAICLNMLSSM